MTRILMIVYGITAEQAAARAPAAQFAVTSVIAALFVWLDSMGMFDDVGRWMGAQAPGGAGCCIRLTKKLATLSLLCAPSATRGAIPSTAPMMAQSLAATAA